MIRGALHNLTVLDLSHALAGPFASTMLAGCGADVIKIEPPGRGDLSRGWGPPFYESESAYFVHLNAGKRSVAIDLTRAEGRELFLDLAERADVILENMRPGVVQKLGVDYPTVAARCPRIIYCSISGFGQDGPYRDRAALDLVVQGESGLISITGEPGSDGVRCGISIADTTAGMYAAFAITAALEARHSIGTGQFLDVSMLDAQLGILQPTIGAYLADGRVPAPLGNAYPTLVPYQTFATKTRVLAIGVPSDKVWQALCRAVGADAMAADPRYATNADRRAHHAALVAELHSIVAQRSYEEWEPVLLAAGVPVGAVNTIDRVVDHPQVQARGSLVATDHPVAGRVRVVGPPVRFSATPGGFDRPAPLLGQHTEDVLRERLGLDPAAITRLREAGAIA
jgi:crotonobetainyl-CoA:carnitine CoA-transferase CaiB-like acyl-CoA transferase